MSHSIKVSHAPFTRSIVRRAFVYLLLSVTVASAFAVAMLFYWEQTRLKTELRDTGNALLTNLVENTRDSISMGQPDTFQRVIDDFSAINGVVEVALFSRYGLMTYESGAETLGRPILTPEGKKHIDAGTRQESNWGLPRREDWSLRDLVQTPAAKQHLQAAASGGQTCSDCHHTLPNKLLFDEKARSHLIGDRRSEFYYRLDVGSECVVCHANWQPGKVAGYLRIKLDNKFFNWQQRQNLLAMITMVFAVLVPSLVILAFVFRRQAGYLEGRVRERTAELAEARDQALDANQRLKELDKLKSDFLASVSHELRTPLTSVLGFAKLIRKDFGRHFRPLIAEDPKVAKKAQRIEANVDIIVQEGERLTRLINDVLDLSKIESGRVDWRDELLSVDELVKRAVEAVSGQFAEKEGVRLRMLARGGQAHIKADRDRMIQVLINLLNNAAKFTDKGEVEISTHYAVPGEVEFRVRDTGMGIPPKYLDKVFDKFQQVTTDDTLSDKPQGTGLGLPICRQIVEHYQGSMWAESDYGRGSTFFVRLPLVSGAVVAGDVQEPAANDVSEIEGGNRVLVVDDEPHVRELLSQMLRDDGYSVVTAASGLEALECAREYRPDLVTMDLMMPGMDGYAAIAELRADPVTAAIPIVVISVLSDRDNAGADAALDKPIDQRRLYDIVGSLLHQRQVGTGECLLVGDERQDPPTLKLPLCQGRGSVVSEAEMWRRLEAGYIGTVVLFDGHLRERELTEFSRFESVQLVIMPQDGHGRAASATQEARDTDYVAPAEGGCDEQ